MKTRESSLAVEIFNAKQSSIWTNLSTIYALFSIALSRTKILSHG